VADVIVGDCVEQMALMPAESVDAIVCDPPYGLEFMGKAWDNTGVANRVETWREALRVLKPGGHLVAFGGTRTYHRMVCAVEDAGFEIRDTLMWLYGQGFPKSHNLPGGIGTALKPAFEPIVLARKPLDGTVAGNVLEHGVGGLNIDGCRITPSRAYLDADMGAAITTAIGASLGLSITPSGRWPANVLLDDGAAAMLDEQAGTLHSQDPLTRYRGRLPSWSPSGTPRDMDPKRVKPAFADAGGASRFFYVSSQDDPSATDEMGEGECGGRADGDSSSPAALRFMYCAKVSSRERNAGLDGERCSHPTVKPIALMRWLCRLVTPPNGLILDPFCGSGSTLIAAHLEGFDAIGIDQDPDYCRIAEARLAWWQAQPQQATLT
jgi:site-specific DNA-methyltransferase (adenine-specific)